MADVPRLTATDLSSHLASLPDRAALDGSQARPHTTRYCVWVLLAL